jgi:hypothetical protein
MENKEKGKGFKAPFDSNQQQINNLTELCEKLEVHNQMLLEMVQNAKNGIKEANEWANDLYNRCTWAEQENLQKSAELQDLHNDYCSLMLAETRLNSLQHAFKELTSSYEILNNRCLSESEMNSEEIAMIIQRANDEIARIQKERDDEKQQYFALQKGFENQIESGKIGFNNLVKRVIAMRDAQKAFFDKKRKIGSAPVELDNSKKLESELDFFLKQFRTNLFIK